MSGSQVAIWIALGVVGFMAMIVVTTRIRNRGSAPRRRSNGSDASITVIAGTAHSGRDKHDGDSSHAGDSGGGGDGGGDGGGGD